MAQLPTNTNKLYSFLAIFILMSEGIYCYSAEEVDTSIMEMYYLLYGKTHF